MATNPHDLSGMASVFGSVERDAPGAHDNVRTPVQIEQRRINAFEPIPPLSVEAPALDEEIAKFSTVLMQHLREKRDACKAAREADGFTKRYERDSRRARSDTKVYTDARGNISVDSPDGHVTYNITQGWSLQGISTVWAFFNRETLHRFPRPFLVRPIGIKAKNDTQRRIVEGVLDDQLRLAQFRARASHWNYAVPSHGTSPLRYRMRVKRAFERDEKGEWNERSRDLFPEMSLWPLDRLYTTNADLPEASDQEGVFFETPGMTLARLQENEVVLAPDGSYQMGRWRNLETLYEMARVQSASANTNWDGTRAPQVSSFPTATLVEYEGDLPLMPWVRDGILTPGVAARYGVHVGMFPDMREDGTFDTASMEEWGRRLAQIGTWNVSFLSDWQWTSGRQGLAQDLLIQFEPPRLRYARNSLFVLGYIRDGLNFLRRSLTDVGVNLEKMGDHIMNALAFSAAFNARPSGIVDSSVLDTDDISEAEKLLNTEGRIVQGKMGKDPSKLVYWNTRQIPPESTMVLKNLKWEFELTTGASAAAKGTDPARGTGTLGEIQLNESKGVQALTEIARAIGEEYARLFKCILEDNIYLRGEEGFMEYAERVTGIPISNIREAMPSVLGLENEIEIVHPLTAAQDPAVVAQMILQYYAALPGVGDPNRVWDMGLGQVFPNAPDMRREAISMQPDDENAAFEVGTWVEPDMHQNHEAHLAIHTGRGEEMLRQKQDLEALLAKAPPEVADRVLAEARPQIVKIDNFLTLVQPHIQKTLAFQAAVQQMQAGRSGAPGSPPGQTPLKRQESPGEPQAPGNVALDSSGVAAETMEQAHAGPTVPQGGQQ